MTDIFAASGDPEEDIFDEIPEQTSEPLSDSLQRFLDKEDAGKKSGDIKKKPDDTVDDLED